MDRILNEIENNDSLLNKFYYVFEELSNLTDITENIIIDEFVDMYEGYLSPSGEFIGETVFDEFKKYYTKYCKSCYDKEKEICDAYKQLAKEISYIILAKDNSNEISTFMTYFIKSLSYNAKKNDHVYEICKYLENNTLSSSLPELALLLPIMMYYY